MSNPFSKLGQISYQAEVGRPQKVVCAESCSDFLSFFPKLRCFLKKKEEGLHLFSCSDLLSFIPKLRCSIKQGLLLESLLIYRLPPQMSFSNLAEFFFVTVIIARKLEIIAGPHQNLKWAAGWTSLK